MIRSVISVISLNQSRKSEEVIQAFRDAKHLQNKHFFSGPVNVRGSILAKVTGSNFPSEALKQNKAQSRCQNLHSNGPGMTSS